MLQDLLGQYDSLVKEHEGLKGNLVATENKLDDATDQISDLKRVISKLESQVKQLEHENQARARYSSHNNTQPSGAGLLHHPDLLMSPSKGKAEPDVTRRKSPSEQPNSGRKSPFLQTNLSSIHKKSHYPFNDPSSGTGSSVESSSVGGSWRCASPPEEGSSALTPMMRALIELEETRATESRAPCKNSPTTYRVGNQRTTVGFVERRHKERSLSPDGHRSSSLPPEHRNKPTTTPTKRGTLLMPRSAKSSPKRCPSENYSTAFGHLMPREAQMHKRTDDEVDQRRDSFHNGSPRKRLQFSSADREDDLQQCSGSGNPLEGNPQLGWEGPGVSGVSELQDSCENSPPFLLDRFHSLTEAEKLLDELTQEKLQVEAALSRMPGAGGRVTLQTRLDEVALENRLERLNRQLGSLRMTLKRFHVLRSSANI
ncbi:M-phase phosphoprotein 9 [Dissostichus eleginoides]|uniref:M-phase phosphoprotein 9 n=1 Tax=Dissostichus eleginoides TaxID=100907 RepID=A0AAD9BIB7_DISEL|nr:M-phase phosphoprotein 9 [Dissostichus eleginoides]